MWEKKLFALEFRTARYTWTKKLDNWVPIQGVDKRLVVGQQWGVAKHTLFASFFFFSDEKDEKDEKEETWLKRRKNVWKG